jgi:hypothetical protein
MSDNGNFAAATLFLFVFFVTIFPYMQIFDGLPPASIFMNAFGMTCGEVIICGLIIAIVFSWSICVFSVTVLQGITESLIMIFNNEWLRAAAKTISVRIRVAARREVLGFRKELKRRESL